MSFVLRAFSSLGRRKATRPETAATDDVEEARAMNEIKTLLPMVHPANATSSDAHRSDTGADKTGDIDIDLPDPAQFKAPEPVQEEPEDAFVLDSSFLDAPYTVIAAIDPAEEVIVVQYFSETTVQRPMVSLAPYGMGEAIEVLLDGQPRALVQQPNGLGEDHVKMMDITQMMK